MKLENAQEVFRIRQDALAVINSHTPTIDRGVKGLSPMERIGRLEGTIASMPESLFAPKDNETATRRIVNVGPGYMCDFSVHYVADESGRHIGSVWASWFHKKVEIVQETLLDIPFLEENLEAYFDPQHLRTLGLLEESASQTVVALDSGSL